MDIVEQMKDVRRVLHDNAEHSGMEEKTKNIIRKFLEDNTHLQIEDYNGGMIAFHDCGKVDTIAFRADFDAVSLPNGEAAHLCGHDGHTAALLGVALTLEELQPKCNVLLIFQPAEETGEGAKAMVDVLETYQVAEIYGCHNLPGYSFGQVYTSLDTFACASCGMTFHIQGKPAHAAYPESGRSPMHAVAELFKGIEESLHSDRFEEGTFATLIGCTMGQKAFGTSAEKAEVWVTVRSRTQNEFKRIKAYLEWLVKQACERDGLSYHIELQDEFPATVNDVSCAQKVLDKCDGSLLDAPMRWSEDFGHFLNSCCFTKGAFFGIGAGNCPDLHTENYEYPNELLEYQMQAFLKLLEK